MKIHPIIFILLIIPQFIFSQFKRNRFVVNHYLDCAKTDTLYYPDKKINGIGKVILFEDSTKTGYKIGIWTEFFPTGQIKSIGTYGIDYYTVCCYAYPCAIPINYKTGEWKYYYENGIMKANGTYRIKRKRIGYNHDKVYRSFFTKSWKFYNNNGERIKSNKEIKSGL